MSCNKFAHGTRALGLARPAAPCTWQLHINVSLGRDPGDLPVRWAFHVKTTSDLRDRKGLEEIVVEFRGIDSDPSACRKLMDVRDVLLLPTPSNLEP